MRPADAYRARHRSPADAYRAKYRDAGSICAIADLRVEDEGVASASLAGLPDDLWRRICVFVRPDSAHELIVAAGSSASLRHALQAEVEQTERDLFGMTRGEAEQILRSERYLRDRSSTLSSTIPLIPLPFDPIGEAFVFLFNPGFRNCRVLSNSVDYSDEGATLRLARAFLAYGVDPDYARTAPMDGKTALMVLPELASQGFDDTEALARLLIKSGADVHATCDHGCTPLVYTFASLKNVAQRSRFGDVVPSTGRRIPYRPGFLESDLYEDRSAFICARLARLITRKSIGARCRSLRQALESELATPRHYLRYYLISQSEPRFGYLQRWFLSQEQKMWSPHARGYCSFCSVTGRYLSIELGPEGNALTLELHCRMKVLTRIGLDRKAVGEPEGHERTFAKQGGGYGGIALKQAMVMVQDHIREGLRKL